MKKFVAVMLLTALFAGVLPATPLIARGATVLKPLSFIGYGSVAYSQTDRYYDWTEGEYKPLPSESKSATVATDVIVGASPLPALEALLVAPVLVKNEGGRNAVGLGDMSLQVRYGVLGGLWPVRLTLAAALALPTSAKDAVIKLADRTSDIGIGASAQTMAIGPLVVHARGAYWLKGKSDDTTRLGNMTEYVVFPDLALGKKASVFATLSGVIKEKRKVNGVAVPNSQSSTQSIGAGMTWNPFGTFWLKPSVSMPLAAVSEGGALSPFNAKLDLWLTLP